MKKDSPSKLSLLFEELNKPVYIPKFKNQGGVLILAGLILIIVGLTLQARHFSQKQTQYKTALQRVVLLNSFYQYNPANVVDVIEYMDADGNYGGTISVLGQGHKAGSCGTGDLGPCAFFWNVPEKITDVRLRPHILLTRMFENNTYQSMKQLDASSFEIITGRTTESCSDRTTYTVKIIGTSGWITSKDVETNCTPDGKTLKYSTTTIDSVLHR